MSAGGHVYDVNDYAVANGGGRGGFSTMNASTLRTLAYYMLVGGVACYAVYHLSVVRGR